MGLDRAIRIPVIATEIVITVLPTMDTAMDAGIMATVTKVAVNVVAMAVHPVGHIVTKETRQWPGENIPNMIRRR